MEKEISRQEEIHEKGFDMYSRRIPETDFGRIKVGVKTIDDAIIHLGSLSKSKNHNLGNKAYIIDCIEKMDLKALREISNYFYRVCGIYQRTCNYFANMYRYDWYVVPEVYDENVKTEKIVGDFNKVLNYLDNSYIKKVCGDIALKVVKDGAYYGYMVEGANGLLLQELPIDYCRTRFSVGNLPAIEFNMRFFDEKFSDINYRLKVLKLFPPEFQKGYLLYKQQKLQPDFVGDTSGSWYLLEPTKTIKFSLSNVDGGLDIPLFVNAIPNIIDLDAAQDLDRRKQMQKLLKVLVQKLPLDKNGDLIFDVDEAADVHNNAVQMLSRAIGVDVLTTFTDVQSINMSDNNTTTSVDDLEKVERSVFNAFGVSKNLFNTDGNMALEKSILNDEGAIRTLLLQFNIFFDRITQNQSKNPKKYNFRLYMLETTQYNYKDISKMYKEQVQIGYSKMLPQIALGHSQSAIINTAFFENEVLHLSEIMIPPLMSSTLSGQDILGNKNQSNTTKTQKTSETKTGGRPAKEEGQLSEKTIQNKESMN